MTILLAPLAAGLLYSNVLLLVVLIALKLFDIWSTNYIFRKGGSEQKWTLTYWLIKRLGAQGGLAVDFALVAVAAWFCYPYWYLLAGLVTYYGYMMVRQVEQVQLSRPK